MLYFFHIFAREFLAEGRRIGSNKIEAKSGVYNFARSIIVLFSIFFLTLCTRLFIYLAILQASRQTSDI